MDLNRLQKLAGMPLTEMPQIALTEAKAEELLEAKTKLVKLDPVETQQFNSSEQFESAFSNASVAVEHAAEVLHSMAFKHWMRESQSNYGFKMAHYTQAVAQLDKAKEKLDALYEALSELS